MSNPANTPETTICLDDIRKQLEKIEDKSLSLEILDYLDSQAKIVAEKSATILEMETRQSTLITENNKLYSRVTAFADRDKPPSQVDYDNVERELNTIIDNI